MMTTTMVMMTVATMTTFLSAMSSKLPRPLLVAAAPSSPVWSVSEVPLKTERIAVGVERYLWSNHAGSGWSILALVLP